MREKNDPSKGHGLLREREKRHTDPEREKMEIADFQIHLVRTNAVQYNRPAKDAFFITFSFCSNCF